MYVPLYIQRWWLWSQGSFIHLGVSYKNKSKQNQGGLAYFHKLCVGNKMSFLHHTIPIILGNFSNSRSSSFHRTTLNRRYTNGCTMASKWMWAAGVWWLLYSSISTCRSLPFWTRFSVQKFVSVLISHRSSTLCQEYRGRFYSNGSA